MIETEFLDRVPAYPGRITLTPVTGQANTYDMARADSPTETGTPLDKATFDSMTKSRLTGRFYVPTAARTALPAENIQYGSSTILVYRNDYTVASGFPAQWTAGQRAAVEIPGSAVTAGTVKNFINSVKVNTVLRGGRRYELVYNGAAFDAKEV